MKNYWKAIGILILLAGIIYYPLLKLYIFLTKEKTESDEITADAKPYRPLHLLGATHNSTEPHDGNPNATLV